MVHLSGTEKCRFSKILHYKKIMSENNTIKLQTDSILHVPLKSYEQDFTFIVNGKRYPTNKIISDLLSPKLSQNHISDPTANEFVINTKNKGDFQLILDLAQFDEIQINNQEEIFISEIFELLGTEKIKINLQKGEININNVIERIIQHEKSLFFYSTELSKEIDFFSEHFSKIEKEKNDQISNISLDTIFKIINNEKLELESEDELLFFINKLYEFDNKFSILYETVCFSYLTTEAIESFISIFDVDEMTRSVWESICRRLVLEIKENFEEKTASKHHYKNNKQKKQEKSHKNQKEIPFSGDIKEGIINYLRKESNINEEVKVTKSSGNCGSVDLLLKIGEESKSNNFGTKSRPNSWISFEFTKHQVKLSNYTIRTHSSWSTSWNPKQFVIEGSNDNNNWTKIDEQNNCQSLNEGNYIHTFSIKNTQNSEFFKFIRIRQTGPNWSGSHHLFINSIEFYGFLI